MRAWKSLLRRKLRTTFAVLGVAIGIAAVVSLVSLAKGFKRQFQRLAASYGADLLVVVKGASSPVFSSMDESVLGEIARIPGVRCVSGNTLTFCKLPKTPIFLVVGLEPGGALLEPVTIQTGRTLSPGLRGEAILGCNAARTMRLGVGDSLPLAGREFRIVGTYSMNAAISDSGAIIALSDAQEVMGQKGKVNLAAVCVADRVRKEEVRAAIEARLPSLSVTSSASFVAQYQQLDAVDAFAWAISFLAALVGGVGVMNTMMMSVFERTREIGVLRAVGWSGWRVLRMIVIEGALLSVLGGVAGIGLGVALFDVAAWLMPSRLVWAEATYSPLFFLQVMGVAILLGLAGSILPGWKASRLDPIEALRYE